ncbi:MAG TPA: cytochrome c [Opitutaceae bacterium]|nr:cytochrome c [Opitutaceae bacterium]
MPLIVVAAALAAGAANPWYRPPIAAEYDEGKYVYDRNCILCHGPKGKGDGELVQNWPIRPRNFTQAVFKYRSTPYGKLPTNEDLQRTIRHGVSGTPMPVFSQLRDDEVAAVIEYLKTFSRDWRNPDNFAAPIPLPDTPRWFMDAAARTAHAAEGKKAFLATCLPCHGENADGNGPAAAALKDNFGQPIHPADLRQPLRSGAEPLDTWRTIAVGINGTPMVGFNGALPAGTLWDLVAYIESIRLPQPKTL